MVYPKTGKTAKNRMSRAKQRGTSYLLKYFGSFVDLPELFSGLFYVAASRLNSPLLSLLIRCEAASCQGVVRLSELGTLRQIRIDN